MAEKKRKKRKHFSKLMQKKLVGSFALVLFVLLGLNLRIVYITAKNGDNYAKQVLSQKQYDSRTIPYKRGEIQDRNGNVFAKSEKVYNVILDCVAVNGGDEEEQAKLKEQEIDYIEPTIDALVKTLGLDEAELRSLITDPATSGSRYQVLKKGISLEEKQTFEDYTEIDSEKEYTKTDLARRQCVQGVWFEEDYVRDYPLKTLASNVIGVGSNSGGASGLESYYTDVLSGTDGREFGYLDENSDLQRTIVEPTNGNTIVSTLDINIQQVVEKYIAEFDAEYGKDAEDGKGAKNIGVIVGNPQNGEIYAMASNHGFDLTDPDDLSDKYTDAELKSMTEEEKSDALNEKWYNYCVSESFEPGSTFKPIVVASALEMGAITTDATYVCDGGEFVTDTEIKCDNIYGHGNETLSDVIKNSCNDAMMQIGMKMQITPFLKYQRLFNFGSRTGIDLPNESTGLLYDRDSMHEVELATNTFGQTFTSTMIQEYAAFNAVVNGGYYYEPHMVKQILDDNGGVVKNINPVLLRQPVSTKNADFVLSAMEQTVLDGTGKKARVPGYRVAGKTGTAEKINPETGTRWEGKYLVSFIGCAPVDDPQLTVYVVVDEPNVENQETGGYSMIISRKIMMEVLPYLNIPQTEEITDELLQELELTREDVENGRNAALIKEKSETTETDEYGNVISSGTTAETDEYGNVISSGTTAETDEYGNVISSGTTSGSTSSATGTTDAQTSQTDAYGNVISGSDSTTQGTTDDEGSTFHSNIPAPLQSQDSGDGVSTQDWITNEKLGIDENNNSY